MRAVLFSSFLQDTWGLMADMIKVLLAASILVSLVCLIVAAVGVAFGIGYEIFKHNKKS
jgi:hypothetical protein